MLIGRLLRTLSAALLILAVVPIGNAQAQQPAGRRIALVIGNSGYRNIDRLNNPANDARLIASTLQASGFTLIGDGAQLDLDKTKFDRSVQAFGRALPGAEVALFYYSGHGMQVQGVNWLVPVDANPTGARDLDFQMVDASLVMRQMEAAGTKLNMLILDACRNNPFANRGVRGTQNGLAEMRAPEGTLISYATQPGNVAADGITSNSPYTAALAEAMRRPGMDVFQVFNQVGLSVKQATAGQQQPWLASSPISGTFNFFSGPVTVAPPPMDADRMFWQSVANSRDPADFQAYLRQFPRGMFAELAQRRSAALSGSAQREPSASGAYDGRWSADLNCAELPGGIRAFSRELSGQVQNGLLRLESGTPGQAAWIAMEGLVRADGRAVLSVNGLSGNPNFNAGRSAPGTPYRYRMESQFEATRGAGSRIGGRQCTVAFTKR